MASAGHHEVLRVVLLGKTGAGKSSTGNTLLEREAFAVARGLRSGTERCQWADHQNDEENVLLQVTDTPGLSDTHRPEQEVLREVGKSVAVASPGPHILLMVLRGDGRFTNEEFMAYLTLVEMFGKEVTKYMIVVFVGADSYGDTLEEQQRGLSETVSAATGPLQQVLRDAEGRFFAINNKAKTPSDKKAQADRLIKMMKELKERRGGNYFQNKVSQEVNDLVTPLVTEQKAKGMTDQEATRRTNQAIVKEEVSSKFFMTLLKTMEETVIPAAKKALKLAKECYSIYKEVKEEFDCSVM